MLINIEILTFTLNKEKIKIIIAGNKIIQLILKIVIISVSILLCIKFSGSRNERMK